MRGLRLTLSRILFVAAQQEILRPPRGIEHRRRSLRLEPDLQPCLQPLECTLTNPRVCSLQHLSTSNEPESLAAAGSSLIDDGRYNSQQTSALHSATIEEKGFDVQGELK